MKRRDYSFCSRGEVLDRSRFSDIHILEATPETSDPKYPLQARVIDASRAVKKFTRSGSSDLHKTYEPRTLSQLEDTVQYLLRDIWWSSCSISFEGSSQRLSCRSASNVSSAYTFVMDRLQAVRQDIISLNMFESNPIAVIQMLRTVLIFYINSMHLLSASYDCFDTSQPPLDSTKQVKVPTESAHGNNGMNATNRHRYASKQLHSKNNPSCTRTISVSSWFDVHSHESALSSCLTTVLNFCLQLPIECENRYRNQGGTFRVSAYIKEFSSYSMLLSLSRQLRSAFQYTCSDSNSPHVRHSTAVTAMKSLSSSHPTIGSDSINILRELYSTTINTDDDLTDIALKCVKNIRQCNPEGAIKSFSIISPHKAKTSTMTNPPNSYEKNALLLPISLPISHRLTLGALLHHMLPELRLCRLMLKDLSDKKDEEVNMGIISENLWLSLPNFKETNETNINTETAGKIFQDTKRIDMIVICGLLGIPVKSVEKENIIYPNPLSVPVPGDQVSCMGNVPPPSVRTDVVILKATIAPEIIKNSTQKEVQDPDACMRYRSTLMNCSYCVDSAAGTDIIRTNAETNKSEIVKFDLTSSGWTDDDDAIIGSHSINANATNQENEGNEETEKDKDKASRLLHFDDIEVDLKEGEIFQSEATAIIQSLRHLLRHSTAEDWFGQSV